MNEWMNDWTGNNFPLQNLFSKFSQQTNISFFFLYTSMKENCYTKDILNSSHFYKKCITNSSLNEWIHVSLINTSRSDKWM